MLTTLPPAVTWSSLNNQIPKQRPCAHAFFITNPHTVTPLRELQSNLPSSVEEAGRTTAKSETSLLKQSSSRTSLKSLSRSHSSSANSHLILDLYIHTSKLVNGLFLRKSEIESLGLSLVSEEETSYGLLNQYSPVCITHSPHVRTRVVQLVYELPKPFEGHPDYGTGIISLDLLLALGVSVAFDRGTVSLIDPEEFSEMEGGGGDGLEEEEEELVEFEEGPAGVVGVGESVGDEDEETREARPGLPSSGTTVVLTGNGGSLTDDDDDEF